MNSKLNFKVTVVCDFTEKQITVDDVLDYIEAGDFELVSIIPDKKSDDQNVIIKLLAKKGV